jgi:hypothetical protein
MSDTEIRKDIREAMQNPKVAGLGHRGIYNKLKYKYKKDVLMREIKNVDSQQIHHKVNKKKLKKQMTPIRASDIGFLQIDFAQVPSEWTGGNVNAQTKYLLVVVDIYSRFMWVVPLPSRDSKIYTNAFETLLTQMKKKYNLTPHHVVADNEFIATEFKSMLSRHNIKII